MQKTTSTSNVKLVEVEVRADSLEKELEQELMCWLAETGSGMAAAGVSAGS